MTNLTLLQPDESAKKPFPCPDLPVLGKAFQRAENKTFSYTYGAKNADGTNRTSESTRRPWRAEDNIDVDWLGEAFLRREPLHLPADRPTGLKIAFLGDSLMRYQTVSLIHYLHTGQWIDEHMEPNLLNEKSFRSDWTTFYEYNSKYFNGPHNFRCDCYRLATFKEWATALSENIFYRDECRDNHVVFLSKFGIFPFRGHWDPDDVFNESPITEEERIARDMGSTGQIRPMLTKEENVFALGHGGYNISEVSAPYTWSFPTWSAVVRNYIAHLTPKPDYLVVNAGLWPDHDLNEQVLSDIRVAADEVGIKAIYKTTTTTRNGNDVALKPYDEVGCRLLPYCLPMNWTALVPPAHYWDRLHFLSYVNTRFNEQLLELLAEIQS
jgi:hypothetical protein